MLSSAGASPAASGILVQPLRAATECEVDLVRKRPDHGNGLRPWIPKQRPEFHLCATESQRLNLNPLTWTSPCEDWSLSVSTHAANHHEVRLVQLCFDFYMIEAKPKNLIGDRAYDSDPLDEELRNHGIEMIAPHRSSRRKPPTQDRRRLSRYMRRWLVERFFAWIQWQRRILVRWEYHAQNFLGFVQLACLVILFRRFGDRF